MALNPPITDWRGRRVWIVGASSGIGAALADALHAAGAQVIASARSADALQAWAAAHPGAQALPLDASDLPALDRAATDLLARGPLDLVVHCAGWYRPTDADLDWAAWERHRTINLDAGLRLAQAVLPAMRARGQGHLSLVSSVAGYRGLPHSVAYGTTKAALTHLGEALHLELAPQGVGVSVVAPGFVQTPMTAQNRFRMPGLITPEVAAAAIVRGWALGRFLIAPPRGFTAWMGLLRCLPYSLYFPLVRRATMR